MLKSFILIPSSDILSYSNEKEYPFNIFPNVVLIYNNRNIVKLDQRDLYLLYHNGYNLSHKSASNKNIRINFYSLKNPIHLITEENENGEILKNIKLKNIKKILPFCLNINNIIISLIKNENLKWKIKPIITYYTNPFLIYNYKITNELNITFTDIIKNIKQYINIDKIIYGTFTINSYIPFKINVTYFNKKNNKIKIDNNYITKILIFTKKEPLKKYITLFNDEHFFTEDNDLEQPNINYLYKLLYK
jgi:hypothetical protein